MEKTDNESKIRELERKFPVNKETMTKQELSAYRQGIRCGASQMAEWKDMEIESLRTSLNEAIRDNESKSEFLEFLYKERACPKETVYEVLSNKVVKFKGYVEIEEIVEDLPFNFYCFTIDNEPHRAVFGGRYLVSSDTDPKQAYLLLPTRDPKRFYCVYYED